jgi:hypothetical protein
VPLSSYTTNVGKILIILHVLLNTECTRAYPKVSGLSL